MIYGLGFLFTIAFVEVQESNEKMWKVLLMAFIWPITLGVMAGLFVNECAKVQRHLLDGKTEKEREE